jgi:hypothetical protein
MPGDQSVGLGCAFLLLEFSAAIIHRAFTSQAVVAAIKANQSGSFEELDDLPGGL